MPVPDFEGDEKPVTQSAPSPASEKPDYEVTFERFWKHMVMSEDGGLKVDQIKRELHDFHFMLEQVPIVYSTVTGGKIGKPNTMAFEVIREFEELVQLRQLVNPSRPESLRAVPGRFDRDRRQADPSDRAEAGGAMSIHYDEPTTLEKARRVLEKLAIAQGAELSRLTADVEIGFEDGTSVTLPKGSWLVKKGDRILASAQPAGTVD